MLTAYHCIENKLRPDETRFQLSFAFSNGKMREYIVDLEADKSNKAIDLAVFKIDYPPPGYLPLGKISRENLTDDVIALGYAAGHKEGRELGFYSGKISSFIKNSKQQFEIISSIQGGGQSGGAIYHYGTNRVVGLAQGKYQSDVMGNAGLALRFDSLFEAWQELKEINDKVAKAWDENLRKYQKPKRQSIHRFYSKLCDRDRQVHDFWNFFQTKCRECTNHPQFYFIHGEEGECHESFIERLINTRIKEYVEKRWGEKYANISLKEIRWADFGNLEIRRRDLKMNLFHRFVDCYTNSL